MKNYSIILPLFCFVFFLFGLSACEKNLPTRIDFEDYAFVGLDENGGDWKPILLSASDQIAVDAPEDVNSAAYQAELAAVKSAAATRSDAVEYWTANPILRWNEIALELAAKYNLIPGPNPDGTYTLPDPANPGKQPLFPFAHRPYTCRMLAYMSVAQFDGLITAWHYKY
ncbi:MAG TPA: phosphoesterase, partial [Flavilitoribacter sp.]|nr:phosphoesterase [Flavilitoribacter sp.]